MGGSHCGKQSHSRFTAVEYVLNHPLSALVYRFSFVISLSVDNENFLRDGSLRRVANSKRDFVHYVYSLLYNDPLPGQLTHSIQFRPVHDPHLPDLPSSAS